MEAMYRNISLSVLFGFMLCLQAGYSQRFVGSVEAGPILSQVAQDKLAGFNKIGVSFGVNSMYSLNRSHFIGAGIFGQTIGSRRTTGEVGTFAQPVMEVGSFNVGSKLIYRAFINPGWDRKSKLFLEGAFLFSRILNGASITSYDNRGIQEFSESTFKRFHGSVYMGAGMKMSDKVNGKIVFGTNVTPIAEINEQKLRPYYLSALIEYQL